jgi:hypothetical protein
MPILTRHSWLHIKLGAESMLNDLFPPERPWVEYVELRNHTINLIEQAHYDSLYAPNVVTSTFKEEHP